jgi:hypothetical protein
MMAENDLRVNGEGSALNSGDTNGLRLDTLFDLYDFFGYQGWSDYRFSILGIDSTESFAGVLNDMERIFNPSALNFGLPAGMTRADIKNYIQTKTSFGVCPHISLKVGYFFNEMKANLYAKFGAIMLNGHVIPQNNLYGIAEEKFNKIAPFAAIGAEKNISDRWGVTLELSHAFRATKRLGDINILGCRMQNRTSVSKSSIRVMAVYRFKSDS